MPKRETGAPPEQVDAGMLVLRRVRAGDAGELAATVSASMDHLRPWMPWARGYTPRMAAEFGERHSGQADQSAVDDAP